LSTIDETKKVCNTHRIIRFISRNLCMKNILELSNRGSNQTVSLATSKQIRNINDCLKESGLCINLESNLPQTTYTSIQKNVLRILNGEQGRLSKDTPQPIKNAIAQFELVLNLSGVLSDADKDRLINSANEMLNQQ